MNFFTHILCLILFPFSIGAQLLPGFKTASIFNEQQMVIENDPPYTRILINAPSTGFGPKDRALLVFYALPNGNTIEQTFGKKLREGDDWHYDIQHIGAQTRFLRKILTKRTLVSPTGGTWYRSRLMLKYLSGSIPFKTREHDSLMWHKALNNRVEIILKPNPDGKIYHTLQVERNGFIQSMLSGTRFEGKKYSYFGKRVYDHLIADSLRLPVRKLNFPAGSEKSEPGTLFMKRIALLPKPDREEEIFKAISSGNIPGFLRNTVTLSGEFSDLNGVLHLVTMEVMPDYLMVGNDIDFYRIPMNPGTAQRIADLTGGSLITAKISDFIDKHAAVRLFPFNYIPVGDLNEKVEKFIDHHWQIEKMFDEAGGIRGQLTSGIKKDIILSERLSKQKGKVVIYGWHLPGGKPIQPVYSGHAAHYVDYSHGIRLMNNQVILDGKPALVSEILKDPVQLKILSDEESPMETPFYIPLHKQ